MSSSDSSDNWYKDWFGEDYLKVYPHRDEAEARRQVSFVADVLPLTPGDKILDLGCGGGRHALELANRGYFVTCFDLSAMLLSIAKHQGQEHCCARFVRGDMRYLPFGQVFDAVVSFFTTFGYFDSDKENLKTLCGLNRVLRPAGKFLQDYMNQSYVLEHLVPRDERRENDFSVVQERTYNPSTRRIEKRITLFEKDTKREYFESVRLYSFDEMVDLLKKANLKLDRTFGDFDGQKFSKDSPRLILLGSKESV